VDKALLDVPHMIRKVPIEIRKGDRNNQQNRIVTPKLRYTSSENNIRSAARKTNLQQPQTSNILVLYS
jgi:hypothetical protein